MSYWIITCGALLGALAVITGAFGAHALEGILDDRARGWYDTAVAYHAGHALAMVACGLTAALSQYQTGQQGPSSWLISSALCLGLGIAIFSGSLYAMAFTGITKLGMITPIGGIFLIGGWLCLAVGTAKLGNAGIVNTGNGVM